MLGAMIGKEIRNHLLSFRFQVTLAMLLVIVPVTVLVLTNDYVRKLDDYSVRQAGRREFLDNYAHFNRINNIIKPIQPPIPFYALIRGLSADVDLESFDEDPLPIMFPLLDLTFIVTILISLAALIFSYDAVSGEKEDGTLKLMMSNGVSRAVILLGKVLGGTISLFVAFAACFGLGLGMILLNPRVEWRGSDWGALALILAGIAVYIVLFHTLGIFISSRHGESASSIMTSLFVWVLVILVIPNISPYAASLISPAPSRIKTNRDLFRISQVERDELGRRLFKERADGLIKEYPFLAGADRMSGSEIAAAVREDPGLLPACQAWQAASEAAWKEANAVQDAKAQAINDDLDRREKAQTGLALGLSMISPLADFTYLATDLSSTGMRNMAYFGRLSAEWDRTFSDYEEKKMAEMKRADPAVSVWEAKADVGDMPGFNYRQEPLGERLQAGLAPLAVLLIGCILLFAAAYVSFIRYDVR